MLPQSQRFRILVKERLALDLSRREPAWFDELLLETVRELGLNDADALLDRLPSEPTDGPSWSVLVDRLTIAETYFFRDSGQIELLRRQLLPQLMREAQGRRLRIWSAGCSSGEELYSVAMLLDGLGNPSADLLGTDINPAIVVQARAGIYRERSLRSLPPELRSTYLQPHGREFRIASRLRERTRFLVENLMVEESTHLRGLDLIICRNVLIYFERERIPSVLERFYRSLRPGGLLLTGHGELLSVDSPFETVAYPQSLVYRRPDLPTFFATSSLSSSAPVERLPRSRAQVTDSAPPPRGSQVSGGVRDLCQQARIARLAGRPVEARQLLRQALYMDPDDARIYLEMSLLALKSDPQRARKHRSTALALLAGKRVVSAEISQALDEIERGLT